MKKLILLCTLFFVVSSFAQDDRWTGFAPLKFGVGVQRLAFTPSYNNFLYTQVDNVPNNSGPLLESSGNTVSYTRIPIEVEYITPNFYFKHDGVMIFDLIFDAFTGFNSVGANGHRVMRFELMPTQLAFGFWTGENLGIYAGAQYAYTFHRFRGPDHNQVGGNQRGFHGVAFYSLGQVMLKGQFQYDWVRHSKRASKGNAQSFDIEAYLAFNDRNSSGLWAGLRFKRTFSSGLSGLPSDDWAYDLTSISPTTQYTFPDVTMREIYFRGGIYFNLSGG